MKNIPTNPFLITGYQGPDYFCDREKETASLMSALKLSLIHISEPTRH